MGEGRGHLTVNHTNNQRFFKHVPSLVSFKTLKTFTKSCLFYTKWQCPNFSTIDFNLNKGYFVYHIWTCTTKVKNS